MGFELDVVAESLDGKHVLVGEAKWSAKAPAARRLGAQLRAKAEQAPFVKGRDVFHALWLKRECPAGDGVDAVVTPSMVLEAVR